MKEQQDRAEKIAHQQQQQAMMFQAQFEALRAELHASLGQLQGQPIHGLYPHAVKIYLEWDPTSGTDNESDDANVHNEATNTQQQPNIQPQIITTLLNNDAKFPYLKKDEYEVALTLKTKGGLELISFDDLYYNFKSLDVDVKGYTTFFSSQSAGLSHSAFVSSTKQQLAYKDFEHIEKLDLEEMHLKWQMAMLSVRVHKFEQKAGRKINFNKKESTRFNKKKVRCYKCQQRGHFARECQAKGGNDKHRYSSFKIKEIGKKEEDTKALITVDTLVDWTDHESERNRVIAAKEFGMIAGSDFEDLIKAGAAKIYNLITGADTKKANTADDAREFALMGIASEENPFSDAKDEGIFDSGYSRSLTDTEYLLLSKDFKLSDDNMVVLKVPRKHYLYTINLNNLCPRGNLACLVAYALVDESMKWHRRMGHVNYKTMNRLVKGNLVRDLPPKLFKNDHTCVACCKGKQHKAFYKSINAVSSITKPLQLLHMDLFGPTSIRSIDHKYYRLVITDNYSRFCWVFFLEHKDETYSILKNFINLVENQLNKKVKTIRCDNGTDFKNANIIELCGSKRIKREYSNAKTSQQNRVAKRKNKTLIEAARTMLADSKLPIMFWTEAENPFSDAKDEGIFDSGYSRSLTDTEYLLLSKDFKLSDDNMVVLKVPRKHYLYTINLNNLCPRGNLACLVAYALVDESMKWHRRMGHVNYKTMNRLVKGNLVRDLPPKLFKNDHTCVACCKGKQHKAFYKSINAVSSITKPLQLLHMDLFGPTSIRSIDHKYYRLVITDNYSRFCWVFFLEHKDETYSILKNFINLVENQLNKKVKTIRCDNGTDFKNANIIELCGSKRIKREYSNAKTSQQNRVAKRKNKTLIEAARTMLADSKLPIMFWTEAVRTTCYVLNRVLVTSPHNKTPYALLTGNIPSVSHFNPFGCHVTILNTSDHLGKFDGKATLLDILQAINLFKLIYLHEHKVATTNPAGIQAADSDSDCDETVIIVPSYPSYSIQATSDVDIIGLGFTNDVVELHTQASAKPVPPGSIPVPTGSIPVSPGSIPVPTCSIPVPPGSIPVPPGSIPVPTSSIPVPAGDTLVSTNDVSIHTSSLTDSFFDDEPTTRFPSPSDLGNYDPSPGIFSSSSYDDEFGAAISNVASTVEVSLVATKRINTIHP
nr:putative ribonuclease H-like domain-containing protein [Tanacetum cinerariifolium]